MKLISTDFSNLGKKTIYDFGDDDAEHLVRFQWMKDLAGLLLHKDPNAKKFFKAIEKEFQKYYKHREEMVKKGIIID